MPKTGKKVTTFSVNSKNSFDDNLDVAYDKIKLSYYQSQKNMKNKNKNQLFTEKNSEKINKRNFQLMRLFKPTPHQQFNL